MHVCAGTLEEVNTDVCETPRKRWTKVVAVTEPVSWRTPSDVSLIVSRAAQEEGPCNNIFRRGHESSALINKQRDCAVDLK